MDVKEAHDLKLHTKFIPHVEAWYANWDNKCPVCGCKPEFKDARAKTPKANS